MGLRTGGDNTPEYPDFNINKKNKAGSKKTNHERTKKIKEVSKYASSNSSNRDDVSSSNLLKRKIASGNLRTPGVDEANKKLDGLFRCFRNERSTSFSINSELEEVKKTLNQSSFSEKEIKQIERKISNFMESFTSKHSFNKTLIDSLNSLQDLYHSLRGKHISLLPKDKGVEMSLPDLFKEISRGDLKERRDLSIGPEMPEKVSRLCYSKISLGNGKAFEEIIQRTRNECGREEHLLTLIESFEELVVKKPNSGTERLHQKNCRKALMNLKSLHRLLYGKTSTQEAKVTEEETSLKQQRLNELLAKRDLFPPKGHNPEPVPLDLLFPPGKIPQHLLEEETIVPDPFIHPSEDTESSLEEAANIEEDSFSKIASSYSELKLKQVKERQDLFETILPLPFQVEIAGEEIKVSEKFNNPDCEDSVKRNKTETDLEALQMRTTLEAYDRVASLLFRDSSESESNELALRERKVKVSEVLSVYYSSLLALHLPIGEVHKKRLCGVYQGKDLERDMQLLRDKKFLNVLCAENKGKNKQIRDFFFYLGNEMESTLKAPSENIPQMDEHVDAGGWLIRGYKEIPQEVRDFISRMEEIEEFSGQGFSFPSKENPVWIDIKKGLLGEKAVEKMEDQVVEEESIDQEIVAKKKDLRQEQEGDFSTELEENIQTLEDKEEVEICNKDTIDTLKGGVKTKKAREVSKPAPSNSSNRDDISSSNLLKRKIASGNLRTPGVDEANKKLDGLFRCFRNERSTSFSINSELEEIKKTLNQSSFSEEEIKQIERKISNFMESFTSKHSFNKALIDCLNSLQDLYHSLRGKHISLPPQRQRS